MFRPSRRLTSIQIVDQPSTTETNRKWPSRRLLPHLTDFCYEKHARYRALQCQQDCRDLFRLCYKGRLLLSLKSNDRWLFSISQKRVGRWFLFLKKSEAIFSDGRNKWSGWPSRWIFEFRWFYSFRNRLSHPSNSMDGSDGVRAVWDGWNKCRWNFLDGWKPSRRAKQIGP